MDQHKDQEEIANSSSAPVGGTSDFTDFPNQFLLFALSAFLLAISLFPLQEADAFKGLASGLNVIREGIAEGGADWFHDLILALVYRGNGAGGVVILRTIGILMFSIHGFGFLLGRGLPPGPASLCLALAVFCMLPVLSAGPVLSGIVFSGGLFFVLVRGPGRGIQWTLPLLFLLWANTAGSTVLPALAATAVYAGARLVESFVTGKDNRPEDKKRWLRFATGILIASVCVLLQPDTVDIYRTGGFTAPVLDLFWLPLSLIPLLALVMAAFVPGAPRRIPHLSVGVLLAVGSVLLGGAWIGISCGAFPFLLAPMLVPITAHLPRSRFAAYAAAGLLVLGAIGICLMPGRFPKLGMDETGYPAATVGSWLSDRVPSPVYCEEQWRGYVAFRLQGRSQAIAGSLKESQSRIMQLDAPMVEGWKVVKRTEDGQIWVRDE